MITDYKDKVAAKEMTNESKDKKIKNYEDTLSNSKKGEDIKTLFPGDINEDFSEDIVHICLASFCCR